MSGAIKIYGIAFLAIVVIFLALDYQKKIIINDDLRQAVKITQSSVIADSLNYGDLRVNRNYSIDTETAIDNWIESFDENRDLNLSYVLEVVDLHENPPAIAVRVKAYDHRNLSEDSLMYEYSNVVIIDK